MKWYICHIEKMVVNICKEFGLNANTPPHTGIWIADNKICVLGVHGSRFITTHALTINWCTDLPWYKHIVSCGIKVKEITTLINELKRLVRVEIIPVFLKYSKKDFNCTDIDFLDRE